MAHDTEHGVKYEPKDYATGVNYPEHIINYYRRVVATYDASKSAREGGLQRVDQLGEDGGNVQNNRNDEPKQGVGTSYPRSAAGEPEEGGRDVSAGHAGQGETVAAQPAGDAQAAVLAKGREGQTYRLWPVMNVSFMQAEKMIYWECVSAEKNHGRLTSRIQRAMAILQEEVGELQKAVNDYTRTHAGHNRLSSLQAIKEELVQVGAIATLMMENILEGKVDIT